LLVLSVAHEERNFIIERDKEYIGGALKDGSAIFVSFKPPTAISNQINLHVLKKINSFT